MKKMNLKKMLTMAMAAMMVMTTTSSSVSAEETMGMMEDKVSIFTYNPETNTLDVEYKDADQVHMIQPRIIEFYFSQNISTSFSKLINNNPGVYDDNNTLFQKHPNYSHVCINLTSYDANQVYYYKLRNETDGIEITNAVTLRTPTAYIGGLDDVDAYSIQLKKTGSSYLTSGSIYGANYN